jgi:CubicO group peptidase (beta-lactamase class C family)
MDDCVCAHDLGCVPGSGWAGTYFWIDPTTGIAAVFGTQIIPSRDIEVIKTFVSCEETLYAGLA